MALNDAVTVRTAGQPCVVFGIQDMAVSAKASSVPRLHSGVEACPSPTMVRGKPLTDIAISSDQYCRNMDTISSATFWHSFILSRIQ